MKQQALAVALVVLLSAAGGFAAVGTTAGVADAQAQVALTVTVTDDFNNAIRDAEVTATWDGGSDSAETASNGKAFLDVPEGADVNLTVTHTAYTLNNPVVVADAEAQEVQIEVFRKATAAVTVRSGDSAIGSADVVLTKQGQDRPAATGTTDGDGLFESGTIEQGTYVVEAVEEGYLRNATTVEVRDGTETTVLLDEGTTSVTFTVRDENFDPAKPVEGASLTIEGPISTTTTSTTGSGERTLGLPANAAFEVTVTKDGYTSLTRTLEVGENDRTLEFAITKEPTVTVEAVNQRVVVGENVQVTATDAYDERIAGATVRLDGEAIGQTDDDGVYLVPIEAAGEHTITVATGDAEGSVTVEGVSTGGGGTPTGEATATGTATAGSTVTGAPLGDFDQPDLVLQVGVAAVGVLLAFLVVRRLL